MGISAIGIDCIAVGAGVAGCHSGVGLLTIGADGCPGAGELVCHWGVEFLIMVIKADGCPEAGDLICHWGVEFCSIGADGCPKAGDLVCHLGVDFFFIGAGKTFSLGGYLMVGILSVTGL